MITHYAITTELARQRRDDIAASIARSRQPRSDRRHWWDRYFRHASSTTTVTVARQTRTPATI